VDEELLGVRDVNSSAHSPPQPGVVEAAEGSLCTGGVEAQLSRQLARIHRLGPAEQLQQHDDILAPEHRLRSTFRNMKRARRPAQAAIARHHHR
jgi:hypothetical protein